MNYIQRAGLVSLLGALWFVTGYFAAAAWDPSWGIYGGSANLIASLVVILLITRTKEGYKLFYEGTDEQSGLNILIWFIWAAPVACAFVGIIWRILNAIARFFNF